MTDQPKTSERYFLRAASISKEWAEVCREKWIEAERAAGFRPKLPSWDPAYMTTLATGGWSNSAGISGTHTSDGSAPT